MKLIISNHKNFLAEQKVEEYINEIEKIKKDNIKLVICPKNSHLEYFTEQNYEIGSQNTNLTFEQLKNYNVKYSIVGHSYFRKNYNETNDKINQKIKELISNNITPILCIGEEENTNTLETLKRELSEGLNEINGNVIIAYEPVWAIGSGKIPDINNLKEVISFIDKEATNILNYTPKILYGGSVNEETIGQLERIEELDGYLIGKASLDIDKLKKIIEVVK